jgi:hypothetical protein
MRVCPNCNAQTREPRRGSGHQRHCGDCGWGVGVEKATSRRAAPPSVPMLTLLWIGSAVVLVGSFLGFAHLAPDLAQTHVPHFLGGLALYLAASNVFNPSYDSSDVGWCGGLVDNPFSYSDDWNRGMRSLVFFFLPGKLVGAAVRGTYRVVTAE